MCSSKKIELSEIGTSTLGANARLVSILASIINMKVVETNASFLVIFQDICLYSGPYSYSRNT